MLRALNGTSRWRLQTPEALEALEVQLEVLLAARRRSPSSAGRFGLAADDEHRGFSAGRDHEDDEHDIVGGREGEQGCRRAGQELPRGPGTDQEAHDQPEV